MTKDNRGSSPASVLITGSTANQTNPQAHERSLNFAGLMSETLQRSGVNVSWAEPSVRPGSLGLEKYDKVLVGLSSPLALGSNRIYGALTLIHELWGDPRLVLYLDAPSPNNVKRGIESVSRNPKSLTKEFFSYRKEYVSLIDPRVRAKLFDACEKLRSDEWPTTLIPAFPWMEPADVETELPDGAAGRVELVNFDRWIFDRYWYRSAPTDTAVREDRWMAEHTANRGWLKKQKLDFPVYGFQTDYRKSAMHYYVSRLVTARGFLHPPSRGGKIWWTPRVPLALAEECPVFTGEAAATLGPLWSVSPKKFESFGFERRIDFARGQREAYWNSIPDLDQATTFLLQSIDLVVPDVQQRLRADEVGT